MEIVVTTFGTAINRDNEGFVISTSEGRQRIPTDGITTFSISRGAQITSDAIMLAIEKEIEIIFMGRGGDVVGRVWSPKYGSISTIRKGQLAFTRSPDAIRWIKEVLAKKIENQESILLMMNRRNVQQDELIGRVIPRMEAFKSRVAAVRGERMQDVASSLMGLEGSASKLYFSSLNFFIPERLRFAERSQHPARDVANALLNYGYGVLYGKVEGSLIRAGIDPYIGVLHRDNYNRPAMVYDVIELYRVWVDYVVYTLLAQDVVTDDYYSRKDDGSCWLEGLGRRVLIQSLNDYLDVTTGDGPNRRSRATQIFHYAQGLAQHFKTF